MQFTKCVLQCFENFFLPPLQSVLLFECTAEVLDISTTSHHYFDDTNGLYCQRHGYTTLLSLATPELPLDRLFTALFHTGNCVDHVTSSLTLSKFLKITTTAPRLRRHSQYRGRLLRPQS